LHLLTGHAKFLKNPPLQEEQLSMPLDAADHRDQRETSEKPRRVSTDSIVCSDAAAPDSGGEIGHIADWAKFGTR
jgi:hypothetical protein